MAIKKNHPDCAVTLSIGEKTEESYRIYKNAGADRYLLRHETACDSHYNLLHPEEMQLSVRKNCLYTLKKLGYQTGAGMMIGSPGQTVESLAGAIRPAFDGYDCAQIGAAIYQVLDELERNGTLHRATRYIKGQFDGLKAPEDYMWL
jgi:hypothetical protein